MEKMANYLQNQGLDSDKMYSESTTENTENTQPFIWPTFLFTAGPSEWFKVGWDISIWRAKSVPHGLNKVKVAAKRWLQRIPNVPLL